MAVESYNGRDSKCDRKEYRRRVDEIVFLLFTREREKKKREQLADRARDHIVIVRFAVIHGIVRILGFLGTVIVFAPSSERKRRKGKKGRRFLSWKWRQRLSPLLIGSNWTTDSLSKIGRPLMNRKSYESNTRYIYRSLPIRSILSKYRIIIIIQFYKIRYRCRIP